MKKFTLFFMSLFLVFGTAMAKDEEKAEFTLNYSTPQNGEMIGSTVYNIRMGFSKAITVEQSVVSIDVVNSNTNETVKIVSSKVEDWDPYTVVFSFEQIEVEGDKGKEFRDQYIETPGTYTYTIPSGLIKSVDGEEFAGGTYTFSIVSTFEAGDWSPKEATVVEDIVVTFDREITEIKLPANGLEVLDDWYYSPVTKVSDAVINEDKKSITLVLETPVTNIGGYFLNLSPGVVISGDAVNEGKSLWFTVYDPSPSFSTNYNEGDRVKELGNLEITFKNVNEVEMVEGAEIIAVLPSGAEIPGEVEQQGNKFVVSFEEDLTEPGNYMFIIPGGAFSMDGAESEGRTLNVELYTFEIIPLEVVSVTPVVGEVAQLDRIVIKFNQIIDLAWTEDWMSQPGNEITMTCGEETFYLTINTKYNLSDELEYLVNAEWDGYQYASTPITAAGTYTIDLSEILVNYAGEFVTDQYGTYASVWHKMREYCSGTYSWTVNGNSSVESIPAAEGEQVIYDLLGRSVERITGAGIYIVNGKKVVIK